MTAIIYKKDSYAIIGACFEVYNEKGGGFFDPSIRNAWRLSLNAKGFLQSANHLLP